MCTVRCGVVVLVAGIISASSAWAQDPRDAIERAVRPGDTLAIATSHDGTIKGRFVGVRDDLLVLSRGGTETQLKWSDIERVQRRRNGVLLGAIIGAGAGFATGIPLAMIELNETGGARALGTMTALGAGVGIAVDALLSVNRTVYERRALSRVDLLPRRGGGGVRVTVTW